MALTNVEVGHGRTALMEAVLVQDIDLITSLIDSGASLEVRDRQGQNVLYHAFPDILDSKALQVLQLLVSKGININSNMDGDGCSALVTAIVQDWTEVTDLLLDNAVDVNEDAMSKFTASLSSDLAYQLNMMDSSTATAQFIFSKGCGHSATPLCCAIMYQRPKIFDRLLQAKVTTDSLSYGTFWRASGNSVCSNCDTQVTPLHMAAYIGDVDMAHTLIQRDGNVSTADLTVNRINCFNEITPLWLAMLKGHECIVKLLLNLGQPVVFPCHFGSGLQVCLEEGHSRIALMLLRAGYDLNFDLDWIQEKDYPTKDEEVIFKIESLVHRPRPLLDWCCDSLRICFGLQLDHYLDVVGAPNSIRNILHFNDLSEVSWKSALTPTTNTENLPAVPQTIKNVPPVSHLHLQA